jgi:hypothetical protein
METHKSESFMSIFREAKNLQQDRATSYKEMLSIVSKKFEIPSWQVDAINNIGSVNPLLLRSNRLEFEAKEILRLLQNERRTKEILSVKDKENLRTGGMEWLKSKFEQHRLSEPYFFAKHLKLYPVMDEYAFEVLWVLLNVYHYVKEPHSEIVLPTGDCIYECSPDGFSLFSQDSLTTVLKRFMLKNIPVPIEILGTLIREKLFYRDIFETYEDMGDEYLNCYHDYSEKDTMWEMMIGYDVVKNVPDSDKHQFGASISSL